MTTTREFFFVFAHRLDEDHGTALDATRHAMESTRKTEHCLYVVHSLSSLVQD